MLQYGQLVVMLLVVDREEKIRHSIEQTRSGWRDHAPLDRTHVTFILNPIQPIDETFYNHCHSPFHEPSELPIVSSKSLLPR